MDNAATSSLPSDWKLTPFRELARFETGRTPARANPLYWSTSGENGFPWVSIGDMRPYGIVHSTTERITEAALKDVFRNRISRQGTLLMSFKLTIGRVATLGVDACHNEAIISIYPSERMNQKYLEYFLSQVDYAEYQDRAVKGNTLNQEKINRILVAEPPRMEQDRIAAVLEMVQRGLKLEEKMIATTRELKQVAVQQLFTHGLGDEERKESEIGFLPKGWGVANCESVCETVTVGIVVQPASYYVEKGVPAFRSLNVREDRLDTTNLVHISSQANESILAKSRLRTNDVLVVRTGYPGTSCVVPEEFDGANCIDVVIVRPRRSVLDPVFLSRFFNSEAGKRQALTSKTGLAQQHLNVGAVKRMLIPIPPLEEQRQINSILQSIDQRIDLHVHKHALLNELFGTLLHELMTGAIRMTDPDTDPRATHLTL